MEKGSDQTSSNKANIQHPYNSANWLSVLTVNWMNDVLKLGSKRPLDKSDLFPIRMEDSMEHLVTALESQWNQEVTNGQLTGRNPRLWKALCRITSWKAYAVIFLLKLLRTLSNIFLPMLVWFFLSDLEHESHGGYSSSSFLYVTGIILLAVTKGLSKNHSAALSEIWGKQLKVACIGIIYKKVSIVGESRVQCSHSLCSICFQCNRCQKSASTTTVAPAQNTLGEDIFSWVNYSLSIVIWLSQSCVFIYLFKTSHTKQINETCDNTENF